MKHLDLENVEEAADYPKLPPGGYVCRITAVEDISDKEYLKVYYDIAAGDFEGIYKRMYDSLQFWGGTFIKSYKEKALPFFKGFITALEKSNQGFNWANCNDDEQLMTNKLIGLVLSEEEYENKKGEIKTRLYVSDTRSIGSIRANDFKVKEKKLLTSSNYFPESAPLDDMPWL